MRTSPILVAPVKRTGTDISQKGKGVAVSSSLLAAWPYVKEVGTATLFMAHSQASAIHLGICKD